jgi:hypothetical protein
VHGSMHIVLSYVYVPMLLPSADYIVETSTSNGSSATPVMLVAGKGRLSPACPEKVLATPANVGTEGELL